MSDNQLIGIDIFSGAGGLSLGAEKVGIVSKIAIEKDINAANTFKKNHPEAKVISDDIQGVSIESLDVKDPFIVFGGPPCQGFSLSNSKTRNTQNKNNNLFKEFVRFVDELSPKWFLFENVEGIVSFNNGKTVKRIVEIFENLGYRTSYDVLNASDFGVPQDRNRFILVGNKIGVDFEFPRKINNKVSVRDALDDLPSLKNGQQDFSLDYRDIFPSDYAKRLRNGNKKALQNLVSRNKEYVLERYQYIKPGQNWKAIPERLMQNYANRNNCHSGIYKRLDPDKPSVVISNYRKNMLIHPFEDRGLSVREAARIQSFPDDFIFEGTLMHIQQQIGNAVPPLLAEAIFEQILKY